MLEQEVFVVQIHVDKMLCVMLDQTGQEKLDRCVPAHEVIMAMLLSHVIVGNALMT